jgi:hypothetical protein
MTKRRISEVVLGALLATAAWALASLFHFVGDIEFPEFSMDFFELVVILGGIAIIHLLWRVREKRFANDADTNKAAKTAEAIGLIGVATIGASVAFLVGHSSDENTRTVGINNVLAQVERVIDSHPAARPCARYLIKSDLLFNFVKNVQPVDLPELKDKADDDKALCLSEFTLLNSQKPNDKNFKAAEWLYLREQVISVLNVLELAADYSTTNRPLSHDEAEYVNSKLDSQKMLARYLDGMTAKETKDVLIGSMKYIQTDYGTDDAKKFWRICVAVRCN